MKKLVLLILIGFLSSNLIFAQATKEANTKMDRFLSRTGVIVKYEDYKLDDLKLSYGLARTKVRKFYSGGETTLFYQISNKGEYSTRTASIAYEDLLEIRKALLTLKEQAVTDVNASCDYLENKFVTEDGVQVGYFVSKGKASWYMVLEKYGKGNSIFVKDFESLNMAFDLARTKMEELK